MEDGDNIRHTNGGYKFWTNKSGDTIKATNNSLDIDKSQLPKGEKTDKDSPPKFQNDYSNDMKILY